MKRTILFFFFLVLGLGSIAQSISVKSFRALPNDMDARQNYPEKDQNGELCAIIKVVTTENGFSFDIGSLGITKTEQKASEIWVYIPHGAKRISIFHEKLGQLRDYLFTEPINEGVCYELVLVSGKIKTIIEEEEIKTVWLIIKSTPAGADVFFNDRQRGVTPCTIKLTPGKYTYRLEKPMYYNEAGVTEISGLETDGRKEINLILKPAFGYVKISTEPEEGATVIIDDVEVIGKTPFTSDKLKSGKHKLTVKKEMFQPKSKEIEIVDGQTILETLSLSPNFASISVSTQPTDANIFIDGIKTAAGSYKGRIPAGIHTFEAIKDNYFSDKKDRDILEGEDVVINLILNPRLGNLDIISNPIDASVYLNGQIKGKTPISLNRLLIGVYELKIEKPGLGTITKSITVAEGKTTEINESFTNEQEVIISSNASEVDVYLNDVLKGKTPLSIKLPFRTFSLKLVSSGWEDILSELTIEPGKSDYYFEMHQTKDVVMIIGGIPITLAELERNYKKNTDKDDEADKNSLEEYAELYANFRLKILDAKELGIDTTQSFKDELQGYRNQLSKPYFTDKNVTERLLHEAYNRKLKDIRASHILVKVSFDASPKDTIAAYDKIMELKNRILKGEDFGDVAVEASDDPSARDREAVVNKSQFLKGNRGDLGYFTVFDMVYPFENGAYNTKLGDVSKPIRTEYGYHLIKVTDIINAIGTIEVAHIFIPLSSNADENTIIEKKDKINSISNKIENGMSFEEAVKQFSEDKSTVNNEGKLNKFTSNKIVPEFVVALRNMQIGEVSSPIQTVYGFHIIKLIGLEKPGTFDQESDKLKNKLIKDSRYKINDVIIVNKIKKEEGFTEFKDNLSSFISMLDTSLLNGRFNAGNYKNSETILFKLGTESYTTVKFASFLTSKQVKQSGISLEKYVMKLYSDFVNQSCLAYEDAILESKYPDFASLIDDYSDGILLFEITDKKVWSKATKDEVGLMDFYTRNKNNYDQKTFDEAKAIVTSDYQKYLEELWINELKARYKLMFFKNILKNAN